MSKPTPEQQAINNKWINKIRAEREARNKPSEKQRRLDIWYKKLLIKANELPPRKIVRTIENA